ncbi:hypothetical protein BJV78DRAFT_227933 [Lactifluus subvellereus]|nr:hypothetical protein BJV78DRAFT_227933 [Lactifluus subvellereus]
MFFPELYTTTETALKLGQVRFLVRSRSAFHLECPQEHHGSRIGTTRIRSTPNCANRVQKGLRLHDMRKVVMCHFVTPPTTRKRNPTCGASRAGCPRTLHRRICHLYYLAEPNIPEPPAAFSYPSLIAPNRYVPSGAYWRWSQTRTGWVSQ